MKREINNIDIRSEFLNFLKKNTKNNFKLVNRKNKMTKYDYLPFYRRSVLLGEYKRKIQMGELQRISRYTSSYEKFMNMLRFLMPISVDSNVEKDLMRFKKDVNLLLQNDAKYHGYTLYIKSAYRSYNEQSKMYNGASTEQRRITALAGQSEHQTGLAIDFGLMDSNKKECNILSKENADLCNILKTLAPRYGFILRFGNDKQIFTGFPLEEWHFRYIGNRHISRILHDYNLSYEEYLIACFVIENGYSLDELLNQGVIDSIISNDEGMDNCELKKRFSNMNRYIEDCKNSTLKEKHVIKIKK